jgi:hypothetical protein
MTKYDRIFAIACGLTGAGILLAILGHEVGILLFVAAALLRPALHEFGLAKQYADERQLVIHSRSGNIGFIVMVLVAVGMALWRVSRGQSPGELYELIALGLAARAITGLVMGGEYRKAGATVIGAVGVFLGIFIGIETWLSWGVLVALAVVLVFVGFARMAFKWPRTFAVILSILVLGAILGFRLYEFRATDTTHWLLFVTPLSCAAACLFLGGGSEDRIISGRTRTRVFGSLATGAAIVFCLLVMFGDRGNEDAVGGSMATIPEGKVVEVQGVPCAGVIEYYKDGMLEFCHLAQEASLSGQLLPAGTGVHFTPEGVFDWCFLQQDLRIQGHLCRGSGHNFMTGFHPNGKLSVAWLAEDEIIDRIPCAKFRYLTAIFHGGSGTYFHENGRLRRANLSRAVEIQGHSFRKSAVVNLDPDGNLIQKREQSSD